MVRVGQELLNVPFGDMVLQLAMAIAESQAKLDQNAVETTKFLAETEITLPPIVEGEEEKTFSLIALGFYPPFYNFPETVIEVKMAITMARSRDFKVGVKAKAGWGPFSASVNASYSSKYSYKVEGSSLIRTKIAPVPPPTGLEKYIDALIKARSAAVDEAVPAEPETPTPP